MEDSEQRTQHYNKTSEPQHYKTELKTPSSQDKTNSEESVPLKIHITNPFETLAPRVTQLIYWENPIHSGAVLAISLAFLIYTAQYSLFNTFCALAFILTGLNWIYVIGRKQLQSLMKQELANPYEHTLLKNQWYIEREKLSKYLDIIVGAVNFLLLDIQKIVLVEDSMRTIRYVGIFYALWTFGSWISFRTIFGIGLVLSFVTPIVYQNHKTLVDQKLDQANKLVLDHLNRCLGIAKQHTGGIYEKAKSFAADKGLVSTTQITKKEE